MFVVALMLVSTSYASPPDTLVMPRDLGDYAKAKGCLPLTHFFDRPGMVNAPFVYGVFAGEVEDSAAFWCKQAKSSDKPYLLLLKVAQSKVADGCPEYIEWRNVPGGLTVEHRSKMNLQAFRYVSSPTRATPTTILDKTSVLVNSYDGLTDVFVCYKGKWLVSSTE
jgi:hypothetical protein